MPEKEYGVKSTTCVFGHILVKNVDRRLDPYFPSGIKINIPDFRFYHSPKPRCHVKIQL